MIDETTGIDISIVIPAYNSEDFLADTISEIILEINKSSFSYEIIVVVDGSEDNTWSVALELSKKYKVLRSIQLLRNYGQHNANLSGFRHAEGSYIITMDDDCQHQPKYIVDLYAEINKGYDVCYANWPSKKHNILRKLLLKVQKI